jgi:hypothetical protein
MPKLNVPILLIDPLEDTFEFFQHLKLSNRFLVHWLRLDQYAKVQQLSSLFMDRQPEIILFNLDACPESVINCLAYLRSNPIYKDKTLAVFTKKEKEDWLEKVFENGANVLLVFPKEKEECIKKLNDLLLIHWQYSLGQFDRNTFLLSL